MRKMSKYTSLFDKYGEVKEKDTGRGEKLGAIDWDGHIKLRGSFTGSAFISGYQHDFIATDLKSSSNPRGSILQEAKNYTDSKIKHIHYIKLTSDTAQVYFTYMSPKADPYTIDTLISSLSPKPRISCSGYYGNLAIQYITSDGSTLTLGVFEPAQGKITPMTMAFNTINDYVE